jgi:hypothetical protein
VDSESQNPPIRSGSHIAVLKGLSKHSASIVASAPLLALDKSRVEVAIGRCLGGRVANPKVNVIPFYIEVEEGSSHRLVIEHALHPVCAFVVGKPTADCSLESCEKRLKCEGLYDDRSEQDTRN